MSVDPIRVIHGLPLMTCDELDAPPYDDASFNFDHTQAAYEYPYLNGASHEPMGTKPIPLPFKLYFLNSLRPGAFPDLFMQWLKVLLDPSVHRLRHPILGLRDVIVKGGSVKLTAQATAGVVVDVQFETTVIDPTKADELAALTVNMSAQAAAADAACSAVGIAFPTQESATSLFDIFKQIEGLIGQAEASVLGQITFAQSILDDMIDLGNSLDDHAAFPAVVLLENLWGMLEDAGKKLGVVPGRKVRAVNVQNPTTLDAFARERGCDLAEIVGLNIEALLTPEVPAGAVLRFYE